MAVLSPIIGRIGPAACPPMCRRGLVLPGLQAATNSRPLSEGSFAPAWKDAGLPPIDQVLNVVKAAADKQSA